MAKRLETEFPVDPQGSLTTLVRGMSEAGEGPNPAIIPQYGRVQYPQSSATYAIVKSASRLGISPDQIAEEMLSFLWNDCQVPQPRLVIYCTGGARNYFVPANTARRLRHGLRKIAQSTDTWVVTGGTYCGVMKFVGEQLHDLQHIEMEETSGSVRLIGIASKKPIEPCEGFQDPIKDPPARSQEVAIEHTPENYRSLDPNHRHIFLVDNEDHKVKWGGEIDIVSAFEKAVRSHTNMSSEAVVFQELKLKRHVYAVVLVIEGGPNTKRAVWDAIETNTPVIVVEGSGRFADTLAYAWRFLHDNRGKAKRYQREELVRITSDFLNTEDPDIVSQGVQDLLDMAAVKEKVAICGLSEELDEVLFDGIQCAIQRTVYGQDYKTMYLLVLDLVQLALTFGREDRAKTLLQELTELSTMSRENMELFRKDIPDGLMWALKHNKPAFVELFYEQLGANGIVDFYKNNKEKLYSESWLPRLRWSYFSTVLTHFNLPTDHNVANSINILVYKLLFPDLAFHALTPAELDSAPFDAVHALQAILQWCVIMTRKELAEIFWLKGGHSIPNAIVSCRMLRAMAMLPSMRQSKYQKSVQYMYSMAESFESLAGEVLDECYEANDRKAKKLLRCPQRSFPLLRKPYDLWNAPNDFLDCMELAFLAGNIKFISHAAVQAKLDEEWRGELTEEDSITHDDMKKSWWISLQVYFSPRTKFWLNALSFLALLMLFSAVAIMPYNETSLSGWEILLYIWIIAMIIQEGQQIHILRIEWAHDPWNILDCLMLILFVIMFAFRLRSLEEDSRDDWIRRAKWMAGVDLILFFIRSLQFFSISANIGPKIIILGNMWKDVRTFLVFAGVSILSYGIAVTTLLKPQEPADSKYEFIFFWPLFQIFADPYIDRLMAETDCVGFIPFDPLACGVMQWFIPLLLLLYLFIVNIMLVNLLIAMFTTRYERIREESRMHWNFMFFSLNQEFSTIPNLPPPFGALPILFNLFMSCCRPAPRSESQAILSHTHFPKIVDRTDSRLVDFDATLEKYQEVYTDKRLERFAMEEQTSDSNLLLMVTAATSNIERILHTETQKTERLEAHINEVEGKLACLEEMLLAFHQNMNDLVFTDPETPLSGPTPMSLHLPQRLGSLKTYPGQQNPSNKVCREARSGPFSGRVVVPDNAVSWDVETSFANNYDPPSLIVKQNITETPSPLPRNPVGRTGLTGRGGFRNWGPNSAEVYVIYRRKRSPDGTPLLREGKELLEFIALKRSLDENFGVSPPIVGWALPGGFSKDKVVSSALGLESYLWELLSRQREEIYDGYVDDPRNTDNAWMHTKVFAIYDRNDELSRAKLKWEVNESKGSYGVFDVAWVVMHKHLRLLHKAHRDLLRHIVRDRKAYW